MPENLPLTELENEQLVAELHHDGTVAPFYLFLNITRLKKGESCEQKTDVVFNCMKSMSMVKREKGDTSLLQKMKLLLAWWFGVQKRAIKI
eukprot:7266924-Ditylum_brightwellii.AAC.1